MKTISLGFSKDYRTFKAGQEITIPFNNNIAVLMGRNGSGKTTLVNCIYSAMKVTKRDYDWMFDKVPTDTVSLNVDADGDEITKLIRFDSEKMNPKGQAMSDMGAFLALGGLSARGSSGQNAMTLFNNVLGDPDEHKNALVLFDEPYRNMDLPHQTIMTAIITHMAERGNLCIVITHDVYAANQLGEGQVVHVPSGELISTTGIRELMMNELREEYKKDKVI